MEGIYIHKDGQQFGPFNSAQVIERVQTGEFTFQDHAWQEGMAEWQPLQSIFAAEAAASAPTPEPQTPAVYYKPSGQFSMKGFVLVFFSGAVTAVVAGILYGCLLRYIPFIYVKAFLCIGFAFALAYALGRAAIFGKIRSIGSMVAFGLIFGSMAVYVSWVSWIFFISSPHTLLVMPWHVVSAIVIMAREGVWSIRSSTPTGLALYAIWFVEACIVVGGSTFMVAGMAGAIPFCERCQQWAGLRKTIPSLDVVPQPVEFIEQLEQGNFAALTRLTRTPGASAYTEVELYQCESCKEFCCLCVKAVETTANNKGEESTSIKILIHHLLISAEQLEKLSTKWTKQVNTMGME
jgi:hypothetical protein